MTSSGAIFQRVTKGKGKGKREREIEFRWRKMLNESLIKTNIQGAGAIANPFGHLQVSEP